MAAPVWTFFGPAYCTQREVEVSTRFAEEPRLAPNVRPQKAPHVRENPNPHAVDNFPLDDLTFVVRHFLPHLARDSMRRILRSEGLSRRPPPLPAPPVRGQAVFGDYDLGFIHIDIKHLPKLQTADGSYVRLTQKPRLSATHEARQCTLRKMH